MRTETLRRIAEKVGTFVRNHSLLVAAIVVFTGTLLIHLPFALFGAFGEQDAARIALAAQNGNLSGRLLLSNQWPFSTPLYIHFLYFLLRSEWIEAGQIASFMTAMSVLLSSVFSTAFLVFMSRATRSLAAALVMTVSVQLCPFFWLSSLYGFPTTPALGVFMVSATLLQTALACRKTARVGLLIVSAALFVISVLFKADMVTAAALFCLPVWQGEGSVKRKILWTAGLFALALLAFWALNRYGLSLSNYRQASANWRDWTNNFYGGISSMFDQRNAEIIARSAGAASFPAALIGIMLSLFRKERRAVVLWIVLTLVPAAVLWSMISGNSARHNLIPAVFVTVLVGLPISFLKRRELLIWGACILTTVTLNYVWWPPSPGTVAPSGRLIESARLFRDGRMRRAEAAHAMTWMPENKILVYTADHLIPYYSIAVLSAPHLAFVKKGDGKIVLKDRSTGKKKRFWFPGSRRMAAALREADEKRWTVVIGR